MEMQAFWQTETKYYVLLPPDHVAVIAMPGAMENWGLIIYGEFALLLTEEEFSSFNKENIATFVAHEVAHQVRDIIGTDVCTVYTLAKKNNYFYHPDKKHSQLESSKHRGSRICNLTSFFCASHALWL